MEAYIATEGMARFCTEEYTDPLKTPDSNEPNDKELYRHLTNFTLNKDNDKFVINDDFLENDNGSKRLLSSVYSTLEKQGVDVENIKDQINDICTKLVLIMQPYLINSFHVEFGISQECNQK